MEACLPKGLTEPQLAAANALRDAGQADLLSTWPPGEADAPQKRAFLQQVALLDSQYPGGIAAYSAKARKLIAESRAGGNPLEGVVPEVPEGRSLETFSADFPALEARGLAEVHAAVFVLVAGGLGERLGYNGIKIELPTNLLTEESYLALYAQWIRLYQRKCGRRAEIPFVIMTSGDTHAKTVALLRRHAFFGLSPGQVHLIQQEKVAAVDSSGGFVTAGGDPYTLLTKPHGNGDVHLLIEQRGLAERWRAQGKRWMVFFQDTNGLAFNTVLPTLGFSALKGNAMTSVTVPRAAGEAIGCITSLKSPTGSRVVCNVEYNQIDPLLRAVSNGKHGDVADASTGFSPYPGNVNTLVMALPRYASVLKESGGVMPEFINPKYADPGRTVFKSPSRLECMMEDYPKLLSGRDNVGFLSFDRWASFSPCKNNLKDAAAKSAAGEYAWGAFSAEADFYCYNVRLLRGLGVQVDLPAERTLAGVAAPLPALVWLSPAFMGMRSELPGRFPEAGRVCVSARSALVLDGDITVGALSLDGALVVKACAGASVHIKSLTVRNKGWSLEELAPGDDVSPVKSIRGYHLQRRDQLVLEFSHPGVFVVDDRAKL
eukprot:TRINITY_DN21234_c0_g2_i1.p1 TRINITY_DN21234_c0_g2~~TRINITY_DN21234_c0_g2_i1.p1  ORF type:complete len:619 (+),score=208.52 TRINITY_DN21234_c0_g2_i1:54-1859(+)